MLSWRLGNVRDITTSLALPDAYRSMAFAAPAFRLDDLPSEARDTVFAALLRRDAARASGVSKAWRDSLGAPHLWAVLDFTDEAAFGAGNRAETKAERRPLSAATVLGACGAARGALTHVTLLQTREMLALLPQLAAMLPLLRRVTLVPPVPRYGGWQGGYYGWGTTALAVVLRLLQRDGERIEVAFGAEVGVHHTEAQDQSVVDLLLNDASPLHVTHLCVTHGEAAARMERCAAVLRAHAHTLSCVALTTTTQSRQAPRTVPITPHLEALCACRTLEVLCIDICGYGRQHRLESAAQGAHPFAAVANALREVGTLRKLKLIGYIHDLSAGPDGATPASLLLPSLTDMEIEGSYPASESDFDARCVSSLAHALQHNSTLRTLKMCLVNDVCLPGDAPDEGVQHAVQRHLDGRPLLPLRLALPTTQLRQLDVETGPEFGLCSLAALASALPRSLEELDVMDISDDAVWTAELPLLLTAVHGLPCITGLGLGRNDDKLFTAESLDACARMLLHPAAALPLLRMLSLTTCDTALPDACLMIADALEKNTTLSALVLQDVTSTTMGAFGTVLQRNATLRSLSLTSTVRDGPTEEPLLAGALDALRTGLQRNVTLQELSLDLHWWDRKDDEEDEPDAWTIGPLSAALEALVVAGTEHPTCTLCIETAYL